jgi:hypothetical protein
VRIRHALLCLFAASAAFVVLVQRDTFVRRWFVPPSTAQAKLGQVLPRVDISSRTLSQAVAELSRLAGVEIHLDPDFVTGEPAASAPPYQLRIEGVSLQDALNLLLGQHDVGTNPVAVARGDRVVIVPADVALNSMTTRVYDVSNLLPPPGPKKAVTQSWGGCFSSQTTPPPQSDRERAVEAIPFLVERFLPYPTTPVQSQRGSGYLFPDCAVFLLDSRLIVTTTEEGHTRTRQMLQGLHMLDGRRL